MFDRRLGMSGNTSVGILPHFPKMPKFLGELKGSTKIQNGICLRLGDESGGGLSEISRICGMSYVGLFFLAV